MKAWFIRNKYYISDSFDSLKTLLFNSAKKFGIELTEFDNISVWNVLLNNDYEKPDFVLFWDKDVKLASLLESEGLKVFNSSNSIRLCDDKALTYLKLRNKNIKQPKTVFSPLLYYHDAVEDDKYIDIILNNFKFPFVFKECFGSFGKQVSLINSIDELIVKIKDANVWPYLIQEFISESYGKDLRIYVVGDEIKATMKRENKNGDFRANIEIGGVGEPYELNEKQKNLAIAVVKELGLSFGGIDLLFGKDDEPIFCEANSNAFFNELDKIANVSIEDSIFEYIVQNIK